MHGQVSQHLAVHFDLGLVQAIDETAVGQAKITCGGVDADDPETAELPLTLTAIAVGILPGLGDSLFGNAIDLTPRAVLTFSFCQYFLVTGSCRDTTFYSSHFPDPPL